MLDSRASVIARTSPVFWVQQEPSDQTDSPLKRKKRIAGDDSSVSWECTGRRKRWRREEVEFVRKQQCSSAREGRSASPPTYPHNNHSAKVAAKATALIEENRDQLWRSCLHLTLLHHWIIAFSVVSWLGRSCLDIFICGGAWSKSLSIIWHPFT